MAGSWLLVAVAIVACAGLACSSAESFDGRLSLSRSDSGSETSVDNIGTGGQGDPAGGSGGDIVPPDPGTGGSGSGGAGSGGMLGTGGAGSGGVMGSGGAIGTGGSGGRAPDGGAGGSGGANGTGGAGTGGMPAIDGCNRANWTIKANTLCDTASCTNIAAASKDPPFAIDGDLGTRYTSGRPQGSAGAETVILTFPHSVTLTGIHLVTTNGDGPADYKVEFATTGTNFVDFAPAAAAAGSDDLTVRFPAATTMKAFRITQVGSKAGPWWSIHELTLTGCTN